MTKLIIALFAQAVVPNMAGTNLLSLDLNDKDGLMSYAADIQSKSSEEEQAVLKTLLKGRSEWHPEAESLLRVVEQRPSSRRLSGVGAHCDGSTKAMCAQQVDKQCQTCHWDDTWSKCEENTCEQYKNQTTCCANGMSIATGCFWNADSSACTAKLCGKVSDFKGSVPTDAETNKQCKAQPGCSLVCETENAAKTSFPGAGFCEQKGDYKCNVDASGGTSSEQQNMSPADAAAAMNAIMALSGSDCNLQDCSICLKNDNCAAKKTSVAAGGTCNARCSALVQSAAATECMFCGPKAAGCTPVKATPFSSCDAIKVTDVIKTAGSATCSASCSTALAACPNGAGQEMKCVDKGKGTTSGAAGLTAAVVGLIAPVFALVL